MSKTDLISHPGAKNHWLDRGCVYGVKLTLCTTEAMFVSQMQQMTGTKNKEYGEWCPPGAACVHKMSSKQDGFPACVVCIDSADSDAVELISMLAHEATHVKQFFMKAIGEKNPSKEFEAYTIQNILFNLLNEYMRQMGHKQPKRSKKS